MTFSRQSVDDEVLKAYLFGDLASDETERLDELSIVDDDFAARLDSVETDLVDAYVRGELSGNTLDKFQKVYLSSAQRRQRVAFAESLRHHIPQRGGRLVPAKPMRSSWLDLFRLPRLALAGGLAMLLVVGFLLFENLHLRENPNQTAVNHPAPQQSDTGRAPSAKPAVPAPQENTSTANNLAPHLPPVPVSVVAFVLAPLMRGAAQIPRLELAQETTRVDFRLDLETNDFPRYRVTLKNLKADRVLWQSVDLAPVTKSDSSTLSVRVPAKLLQQGMYQLDLTGAPANGEAGFAGSYVFRIVTR